MICAIVLSVIITRSVSLLTLIFISEFNYSFIIEFDSIFKISEFEEPEEPNSRSFFSEIIGTISDVKFSHNGRYLLSRDYLTVKVWDLHMENKPIMSFQVSNCLEEINPMVSKINSVMENSVKLCKFSILSELVFMMQIISLKFRFINISHLNYATCMRTTVSLTNLNAAGVERTRKFKFKVLNINNQDKAA